MTAYEIGKQLAIKTAGLNMGTLSPAMEVAGLGMLAIPTIDHMTPGGHDRSRAHQQVMNAVELGGLGVLATPSLLHLLSKAKSVLPAHLP